MGMHHFTFRTISKWTIIANKHQIILVYSSHRVMLPNCNLSNKKSKIPELMLPPLCPFTLHFGLFSNTVNCTFMQLFYCFPAAPFFGSGSAISPWMIVTPHHPGSSYLSSFFWCYLCNYSETMAIAPAIIKSPLSRWSEGAWRPPSRVAASPVLFSLLGYHRALCHFTETRTPKVTLKGNQFCFCF